MCMKDAHSLAMLWMGVHCCGAGGSGRSLQIPQCKNGGRFIAVIYLVFMWAGYEPDRILKKIGGTTGLCPYA